MDKLRTLLGLARRDRRTCRPRPSVESLEGRALLSGVVYAPVGQGGAEVAAKTAASGTARKSPAFYEFYTGPKERSLDVVAATVRLVPGKNLTLTGVMQGKIDKAPATADQQEFYVFGIDRQSPKAVTPFFQRPGITFDAVVVVSVQAGGVTASATDLVTHATTTLDPKAVHIAGNKVTVTVDPALFPAPAGGVDLSKASFNLWPRSSLDNTPQANHGSFVASFVPENATAPVGVVGRRGR